MQNLYKSLLFFIEIFIQNLVNLQENQKSKSDKNKYELFKIFLNLLNSVLKN